MTKGRIWFATEKECREFEEQEHWRRAYKNRTERLAKLLSYDAPEVIIRSECWLTMQAVCKGHALRWLILSAIQSRVLGIVLDIKSMYFRWIRRLNREESVLRATGMSDADVKEFQEFNKFDDEYSDPPPAGNASAPPESSAKDAKSMSGGKDTQSIPSLDFCGATQRRHEELVHRLN